MKFFDKTSAGSIINKLSVDIFCIDFELPWQCHVFLENLAICLGYPIGILINFPYLILIFILAFYFILNFV